MTHRSKSVRPLAIAFGAFLLAGFVTAGCESSEPRGATPAVEPPAATAAPPRSGAILWQETCSRCHNLRTPSQYSAAQWEVAVMHMRVRAKLTGEQARSIEQFLKSASASQ